jgi:hypothetical protein
MILGLPPTRHVFHDDFRQKGLPCGSLLLAGLDIVTPRATREIYLADPTGKIALKRISEEIKDSPDTQATLDAPMPVGRCAPTSRW